MENDAFAPVIEKLKQRLEPKLKEVADLKRMINMLCVEDGRLPMYKEDSIDETVGGILSIRSDHFVGKGLATAIKEYLTLKNESAGVDEIFDALCRGGFAFEGKDEGIKKRNLMISLGKNPAFKKIANGTYGLSSKYRQTRKKENNQTDERGSESSPKKEMGDQEENASSNGQDAPKKRGRSKKEPQES